VITVMDKDRQESSEKRVKLRYDWWTLVSRRRHNMLMVKGKCALGPFLSILVIECKHKGLNVKICSWMNKV
jgi:hypothetical protein